MKVNQHWLQKNMLKLWLLQKSSKDTIDKDSRDIRIAMRSSIIRICSKHMLLNTWPQIRALILLWMGSLQQKWHRRALILLASTKISQASFLAKSTSCTARQQLKKCKISFYISVLSRWVWLRWRLQLIVRTISTNRRISRRSYKQKLFCCSFCSSSRTLKEQV